MKSKTLFSVLVFAMLGMLSCSRPETHSGKKLVLVSIPPYELMIEQIAGDTIDVASITKESTDPHTYEPSAKEASRYKKASLWFGVGEEFEIKLKNASNDLTRVYQNLMEAIPTEKRISACSGCHHHHHHHQSYDNHIWLNFSLVIYQLDFIREKLSLLVPENSKLYKSNYLKIKQKLQTLAQKQEQSFKKTEKDIIVTVHNCLAYFLQNSPFRQVSIEAEGEKEPHITQLGTIYTYFTDRQVLLIVSQPQHLDKSAKMLAEEFTVPIISFNPYVKNYIENINLLAKTISSDEQK